MPTIPLPLETPLTRHVTDVFEALWTVAVNCLLRPTRTSAIVGEIEMLTGRGGGGGGTGFVIVTDAPPFVASGEE